MQITSSLTSHKITAMRFSDMLGLGKDGEDEAAEEATDKATDQLSAPAAEESVDLKLHAQRCSLRFYLTRAEVRAVRASVRLVRSEVAGVRILLLLLVAIVLLGGTDGGALAKLFALFFHTGG